MLFQFFKKNGCVTAYNFVQINTITHNYAYYKIVQLKIFYNANIAENISKMR
jgi:hypothetical protein